MKRLVWPISGSLTVVILPPILILVTGREMMDLIVLLAALIVFWAITRLSRREVGLRLGDLGSYAVSLGYPVVVMAALGVLAWLAGQIEVTKSAGEITRWLLIIFGNTWLAALITEEGFFRGWLWGSLERSGVGQHGIIAWTTVAFALWHIPTATIEPSFSPPANVVPTYLANVFVLGATWGVLRAASGSIVLTSFCHAVWNALTYGFFGYGQKTGDLGITNVAVYDPERGLLGLALNLAALGVIWWWWRGRSA